MGIILSDSIIRYFTALLMITAVFIKTAETIMCVHLLEEVENIGASKNKFIKQVKLKFENSCKLNSDVRNVEVFVKRHLDKYKAVGFSFRGMEIWVNSIKIILLIFGFIESAFRYYNGNSFGVSITYLEYAIGGVLMIYLAETILDCDYKKQMLVNNFTDFFDNILIDRMRYERNILEEEELSRDCTKSDKNEEKTQIAGMEKKISEKIKDTEHIEKRDMETIPKKYDKELIEEILNQFLA